MQILSTSLCLAVAFSCTVRDAHAQDNSICTLAPGQQARIAEIRSDKGTNSVPVERAGKIHQVTANCLIQGGDIVRPLAGSTVTVVMPSGDNAIADVDHPLVIPKTADASRWTMAYDVLKNYVSDNLVAENSMANVKMAQGRALDHVDEASPVVIPGLPVVQLQNVTSDAPLWLRWAGGAGPYTIRLQPDGAGTGTGTSWTSSGSQFQLPAPAPGNYVLSISCAGCTSLDVRLHAVPISGMPSSPDLPKLAPEDRSEVEAVWLLTEASPDWRLEALSRLQSQARDRHDVVAQTILAETTR